jgi:uncharacterized protein YkwD
MRNRMFISLVVVLLWTVPALADVIYLNSGGVVKGLIVSESRREVVVRTHSGTTTVPRTNIERIERGASPQEMYQQRLAKIDASDPEAHYSLGLWCKSINLRDEAKAEFTKTIELVPDHVYAHRELGHVRHEGRWVERASLEASASAEPSASPRKERTGLRGVSGTLSRAVLGLRGKDADARADAYAVLADEAAEVARLTEALRDPESRGGQRAWSNLRRRVVEAEGVDPTTVGPEALNELATAYVEGYARDAVNEALGTYGRWLDRAAVRLLKKVDSLYPDRDDERETERRTERLSKWVGVRDDAVEVIFDKSIYPDENHGRVGQPTVDEHVERVRAAWEPFNATVERDLARFLNATPEQALQVLRQVREAQARFGELRDAQSQRGLEAIALPKLPAAIEIFLTYQAGEVAAALARKAELSPYEQELLKRLRDERVRAYNASFTGGNPQTWGVDPSGVEIEQVRITNDYRIMMGRHAVEIDPRLVDSARGHSADMTRLGFFDHTSPITDKKTPFVRMAKAGYQGAGGENISLGSETPQATHNAWYNSSGHHRNILNAGWTAMGSGQDGTHWTQNFGSHATLQR